MCDTIPRIATHAHSGRHLLSFKRRDLIAPAVPRAISPPRVPLGGAAAARYGLVDASLGRLSALARARGGRAEWRGETPTNANWHQHCGNSNGCTPALLPTTPAYHSSAMRMRMLLMPASIRAPCSPLRPARAARGSQFALTLLVLLCAMLRRGAKVVRRMNRRESEANTSLLSPQFRPTD